MGRKSIWSRTGFTLVELLVVVSIIALLISILLPSLSKARGRARSVKCHSIQKQLSTANFLYANDNENYFVPLSDGQSPWNAGRMWVANDEYRSKLGLREGEVTTGRSRTEGGFDFPDGLICPSLTPAAFERPARVYENYGRNITTWSEWPFMDGGHVPSIPYPSESLQQVDSTWELASAGRANYEAWWDLYGPGRKGVTNDIYVAYRHMDGANVQFFDGHVKWMSKEEIYPADATERSHLWSIYE